MAESRKEEIIEENIEGLREENIEIYQENIEGLREEYKKLDLKKNLKNKEMNDKSFVKFLLIFGFILTFWYFFIFKYFFKEKKKKLKLKWNDFIYPKTFLSKKIRYFISFISFLISLIFLFSSIYFFKNIDWCEFPTGRGKFSAKPETNWISSPSLLYFLSNSLISISSFIISFSMIFNIGWRLITFRIFHYLLYAHPFMFIWIFFKIELGV